MICKKLIALKEIQKAKTIFSYLSMDREVDLSDFHSWVKESGKILAFPVCKKNGSMDAYAPEDDDTEIGLYGIRTPIVQKSSYISPDEIDIVIVPCVGFDKNNNRLGHGGGYYDRYIPKTLYAKKIIVAFEAQKIGELTVEKTDCIADKTLTELSIY